ncbi:MULTISPECIES: hypothetical protein [Bacillus cereus group]|uniref:hypothetical protein n=2 Tax=Bacillus cereus group TaxID=86661 RepID=UPI0029C2BDCC|nr:MULTISPECIES: hypothetical protein [unclassified Bacillus cereus group]MDX5869733.1 hypothetical protein [Bacillus cereus group sp. BfR-BA-01119]MDX5912329.1 hypothetical protein [Bacillus cereus group sp. BfR-BA-01029]
MLFVCRLGEKSTRAEKTSTRMEQSEEGGDFLSVFLKKYYLFLVKVLALKEKEKKRPTKSWSFFKISKGLNSPFDIRREEMSVKKWDKPSHINGFGVFSCVHI